MNRLSGKVILVTGSAQGLGKEYALALAKEGATVVVADIAFDNVTTVAEEIRKTGGNAIEVHMDVTNEKSVKDSVQLITGRLGRIDVLINNAAIIPENKPFYEISTEDWDKVMNVNVKGCWLTAKSVLPIMKSNGHGKIINVTSTLAMMGANATLSYAASKGAIISMTRSLAKELGGFNITVNEIAPGLTITEGTLKIHDQKYFDALAAGRCLKRSEYPKDIVGTIIFLCSEDSDFITGQTLIVDGGAYFV